MTNPTKIISLLERGREELGKANVELKRIGYERAVVRGDYYGKTSAEKGELLEDGNSAAASGSMADSKYSELLAGYKRIDAEFETQSKYCKYVSAQLNALQTIMNGLKSEGNQTGS